MPVTPTQIKLGNIHVLPVNDLKDHDEVGLECKCGPRVEKQSEGHFLVIHNSFDKCELFEKNHKHVKN